MKEKKQASYYSFLHSYAIVALNVRWHKYKNCGNKDIYCGELFHLKRKSKQGCLKLSQEFNNSLKFRRIVPMDLKF